MTTAAVHYSASVMCANLGRLEEDFLALERAGCHELHFDVMDGLFVPNITLGSDFIHMAKKVCKLPCAAHLMISKPELYIERYAKAGADTISVHIETCRHAHRTLAQIRDAGASPGIAINPATPLSQIDYLLESVDRVMVMTVDPGYAGQKIVPNAFEKVEQLKQILVSNCLKVDIEVDGNINLPNAKHLVSAGANILVLGTSSIFTGAPTEQALRDFDSRLHAN